jgi:hypothetical protein
MAFDRSKFKATEVATLKQQESENQTPRGGADNDGRVSFHKIPEGQSKWRIMPAHPDAKSFMYPKQVSWLPQEVTYTKDGKEITEIQRRPLFNSRTHGGTPKDIIEEYIKFVEKIVYDECQDPEERKTRLFNLTNWKVGVRGRITWIVYALKIEGNTKTLGRLELPGMVKDTMNTLAITEDQSNDVIQTDPFSDPDLGKAIIIVYNKAEKDPSKKYTATLEWRGDYTLTDQELEDLIAADSLETIYQNCYKRKDFEKALNGLRIFDEENGYHAFAHDEWLDICTVIDAYYPEDAEEDEDEAPTKAAPAKAAPVKVAKAAPAKKVAEPIVEEYEEEEDMSSPVATAPVVVDKLPWEDDFDNMDRAALKAFIMENELDIQVLPKYSDDEVRDFIRQEMEIATAPSESAEPPKAAPSTGSRMADMKAKLAKKA